MNTPLSNKRLPATSDWTFDKLELFHKEIARVAAAYKLDTFPNQLEIITSEQMMDAYASVGMPVNYHHWSYGKNFLSTEKQYRHGQMGLAYEIVINSNPCISYLMEENSMTMQALVIAHAAYGHNSFFKGNYLFKTWTSPDAIIDYLVFARNYISDCEEKHGEEEVELFLDSCHALSRLGVDRYKRPSKISLANEKSRQEERERYLQAQVNELWMHTIPGYGKEKASGQAVHKRFPPEPEENILYFIEKNAPLLKPWQREIIRIVRKMAQYFYPQRQTQVMNEGWATFWHYTIMNTLFDEGLLDSGMMIEFLQSHTGVTFQPPFNHPYYSGINPYALGFAMWKDIRRICEEPTEEDRRWFPEIAGSNWRETFDFAMKNYKDESFVGQYLSPKVIRDFKLFSLYDGEQNERLFVSAIHDDEGYQEVRDNLSEFYNLGNRDPSIQVYDVQVEGDRSLILAYTQYQGRRLDERTYPEVMKHVARLWGFEVKLDCYDGVSDHPERLCSASPPRA